MEQLSRAGIDVPLQLRDVLDDLRLGRLTVRTSDALAPQTFDRLGRRIFTGMVFAALALSGGLLIAADRAPKLGPALLFGALAVWVAHMLSDWRRGRLGRQK
jgi:ubiquinone biosynthesis protein